MNLLFEQYKYFFIGGFFLLMLIVIGIKTFQVNSLRAELAEYKAQTAILSSAIEKQNDSVKAMQLDSDTRLKASAEAVKKAQVIAEHRQPKINELQKQAGNVATCEKAIDLAKGQL